MNRSMQDDFKRDGMVSQMLKRIAELEAFEREFRLKKTGGSSVALIQSSPISVAVANVDWTNIPSTYSHLKIVSYLRATDAVTISSAKMLFNNDSGANYDYYIPYWSFNLLFNNAEGIATATPFSMVLTGSSAPANQFGVTEITIPNYAGSGFKSWVGPSHVPGGNTSGNFYNLYYGGQWRNTSPINRITISSALGGNLDVGSMLSLYGVY